jgi:hypothetical protein
MMAILKYLLIVFFIFISTTSNSVWVKKNDKIIGNWDGKYHVDNLKSQGWLPYGFVFSKDGSVITVGKGGDGKTYYATGYWNMTSNNILKCKIVTMNFSGKQVMQSITAEYSNKGNIIINGKWHDVNNQNGFGNSGIFSELVKR